MNRVITTMVSDDEEHRNLLKVFLYTLKTNGGSYEVVPFVIYDKSLTPLQILYTRPQQMMDLLNKGYDQIASIDADVIFRSSIDRIWDGVTENTVKYLYKKSKNTNLNFQGGVFILGNGEITKKYWKGIMDKIPVPPSGYDSQRLMFTELKENPGLNVISLHPTYNDSLFKYESIIWHGKNGLRNNPVWEKSFIECLRMANA